EAFVEMGPSYLPGSTSTVSPGCARVDARTIVAHGARCVQGFESLPSVATYHVFAVPASEAPRKTTANAARISRTLMKCATPQPFVIGRARTSQAAAGGSRKCAAHCRRRSG